MTTPAGAVAGNARQVQASAPKGQGFFQKKYGPLPGWGWAAVAGVGAIGYFWWRKRKAATATTAATAYTGSAGTGYAGSIAALQREIDALQGSGPGTGVSGSGSGSGGGGTTTSTTTGTTGAGGTTTAKTTVGKTTKTTGGNPAPLVTVPEVKGERTEVAGAKLKALGLVPHAHPGTPKGKTGHVGSQTPAAGKKVKRGTGVDLQNIIS